MKSTITDEFGKEIDIDTAIDTLRDVRRHHYDGTPYEVRLASLMAIATMQKYQRIEEVINRLKNINDHTTSIDLLFEIVEIIEDGK